MPVLVSVRPQPPKKIIRLPADIHDILARKETLRAIAHSFYLQDVPRRQVPDWISERVDHFDGDILFADGRAFKTYPGEIDDAFGDEPSFRWISDLYRYIKEGPKQKPQAKVRKRMLLLTIALMNEECFHPNGRATGLPDWPGYSYRFIRGDSSSEAQLILPGPEMSDVTLSCLLTCPMARVSRDLRKAAAKSSTYANRTHHRNGWMKNAA